MSRSNTASPLSNDGLRYTAQELEILTKLSTLDADNFVNQTDPVAAVPVVASFRAMALGILKTHTSQPVTPALPPASALNATRPGPETTSYKDKYAHLGTNEPQ